MAHRATPEFWYLYRQLPDAIRALADKSFERLKQSPSHPSLRLKKVIGKQGLWSARVGRSHRALAYEIDEGFLWFWIGTHDDYDQLIS
jgi:hypothetical protein